MTRQGVLLVVSGPSGVGKGAVIGELLAGRPEVAKSVSCSTRSPRPGEIDGIDYHFVTPAEFERMRDGGELLEWATVHQDLQYGTPRGPVEAALAAGQDIILEIDYQGAQSVREIMGERAAFVFIAPPRWEDLVERLKGRSTESPEATAKRLASAIREFEALVNLNLFEYLIINDRLAIAVSELEAILLAERQKLERLDWRPFVAGLLEEAGK